MVRKIKLIIARFFSTHTYLAPGRLIHASGAIFGTNIHPPFPKTSCRTKPSLARPPLPSFWPLDSIFHQGTHARMPSHDTPCPLLTKNAENKPKKKAAHVNQRDCDRWAKLETALCICAFSFFFWLGNARK